MNRLVEEVAQLVRNCKADMNRGDVDELIAQAVTARILAEAAKVAREYKSSLRPGSQERLHGHQEAAKDIAHLIERLGDS